MSLEQKIILITGASSGIGRSCAQAFARQGSRLLLVARRGERLADLSDKLGGEFGVECHTQVLDVRDRRAVRDFVLQLPEEWSNIDILVNNAGLSRGLAPIMKGTKTTGKK